MAGAARFLRAKLFRLSLMYIQKSRPFITAVLRLSLNSASRWRRFCSPPRKSLHWGVAVGTTGILCGSVAFFAASSDSCKMADDGSLVSRDDFDSAVTNYLKGSDTKADYQTKIEDISNWMDEHKDKGKENDIKAIDEALKTTVNALEKFSTGDPYDITRGTLDIIASIATVEGGPYGAAVGAFCVIAGAIVSAKKPEKPSVVEQLAEIVHSELINFNRKLQNQNLSGLQGRIRRQLIQLQKMTCEEELDDANLWNEIDHFMGELRHRISSPLPFKYDKNLKDPEMEDFVKALETYCRAYTCFMALLTVAKVKFEELSRGDDIEKSDRFIRHQRETVKETMSFLSEKKHLTFLGRLPSEGGSLTKILLLSRNPTAKKMIESTRCELGLPVMPESQVVEEKAEKVSRQSVKLKWPAGNGGFVVPLHQAVFCNETDFPIRVVSGTVGKRNRNLTFEEDVPPHTCYSKNIASSAMFSIGGYMKIAYNGRLSPKESENPNEEDVGIIEFAMSRNIAFLAGISDTINIQDKSDTTRTQGQDTYDKMTSGEDNVICWKKEGKYYLAKCEICLIPGLLMADKTGPISKIPTAWRFIIQAFDPEKDVEETSQ